MHGVDVLLQLEGGPEATAALVAQMLFANVVRLQRRRVGSSSLIVLDLNQSQIQRRLVINQGQIIFYLFKKYNFMIIYLRVYQSYSP